MPRRRACGRRARFALVLLLALAACDEGGGSAMDRDTAKLFTLRVGYQRVRVEVAATHASRQRGLMHRGRLPDDRGMLFVFADERPRSFWMKDTPIPLSIAFARADGTILRIVEMEPLSERAVSSVAPARYALEMNRGWFTRHGILEGDVIRDLPRLEAE
jgi:uncharacterized protein